MRVGVPKEIKTHEYRVGLTPGAVENMFMPVTRFSSKRLRARASAPTTRPTARPSATIAGSAAEVFAAADMIVKVKEPQPNEWVKLRPGQILFTYLHLAADPDQARGLLASRLHSHRL